MLYFHISRIKRALAPVEQLDWMAGMAWVKATHAQSDSDIKLRMTSRVRPNLKEADPKNCTHAIALISDHRIIPFNRSRSSKKRDNGIACLFSGVRIFPTLIA